MGQYNKWRTFLWELVLCQMSNRKRNTYSNTILHILEYSLQGSCTSHLYSGMCTGGTSCGNTVNCILSTGPAFLQVEQVVQYIDWRRQNRTVHQLQGEQDGTPTPGRTGRYTNSRQNRTVHQLHWEQDGTPTPGRTGRYTNSREIYVVLNRT